MKLSKRLSFACACCFVNLSLLVATPKPLGAVEQPIHPTTETAIRNLITARIGTPSLPFTANGRVYYYRLSNPAYQLGGVYSSERTFGGYMSENSPVDSGDTTVSIHQTSAYLNTSFYTTTTQSISRVLASLIAYTFGAISSDDLSSSTSSTPLVYSGTYSADYVSANETGIYNISGLAIPYPVPAFMANFAKTFVMSFAYHKYNQDGSLASRISSTVDAC